MRIPLSSLTGKQFDAAVIGAGVNGASTAQHLAAAGYSVLLVDKGDFASGSSSRSSRLLHCGLRYLAPGSSPWEFVRHPKRFATACRMAKAAMQCRAEFVQATGERTRPLTFAFPFYEDSPYSAWQIDAAFKLLKTLGPAEIPLDYHRLSAEQALQTPLLEHLRQPRQLRGVATFREYQFDWPERIVVDTVLDAERMGAMVRNYTSVISMQWGEGGWSLTLGDEFDKGAPTADVKAKAVFNMAGIWIDEVNQRSKTGSPSRHITGTKGTHIVVQLPPECADYGIVTLNRRKEPFYCVPWRGLHYFGPTETLYEGNIDDIRPTEEEFQGLLDEATHLLPGLRLKRSDIKFGWAGVRPLTYDPDQPMGARDRSLHDLSKEGMPQMFAMTAGPIMTHRSAGVEATNTLKSGLAPSGKPQTLSYSTTEIGTDPDSPPLTNSEHSVRVKDVERAVTREYGQTLIDVMFRRTGEGWSASMGRESALAAAQVMGKAFGWDEQRIKEEYEAYVAFIERQHAASCSA